MFIHRENALKAHQHISYYSTQSRSQNIYSLLTCPFKKTILVQNLIKIFIKTHQIAHFFKIFWQSSMCTADIDLKGQMRKFYSNINILPRKFA